MFILKKENMHIEMKYATNTAPAVENVVDEPVLTHRSPSIGSTDGLDPEVDAGPLTFHDKTVLSKRLMRPDVLFRDRMHEIVKDFPTMRGEVGGENIDKTIDQQLFDCMQECRASINDNQNVENEGILKQQLIEEIMKPVEKQTR